MVLVHQYHKRLDTVLLISVISMACSEAGEAPIVNNIQLPQLD
jgi:hypothetical protein